MQRKVYGCEAVCIFCLLPKLINDATVSRILMWPLQKLQSLSVELCKRRRSNVLNSDVRNSSNGVIMLVYWPTPIMPYSLFVYENRRPDPNS